MFDSAWPGHSTIQFSLTKKNKDWTSRTLTTPPPPLSPPQPLRLITSHFCLTNPPLTPLKVGLRMYNTPTLI